MSNSEENQNQTMARVAVAAVNAADRHIDIEGVPLTVGNDGRLVVLRDVDNLVEERKDNPRRRRGTTELLELKSFIDHINRFQEERTTIWANARRALFTAIYNDNPAGDDQGATGWRDFRATYSCPLAPEWAAWLAQQEKWMTQEEFADWIDGRMEDLTTADDMPAPVEVLELARNLQIYTKGVFAKKVDPTTGQFSMVCKEEHTSESTKIPRAFMTALRIFDGGEQYAAEIRVRFKLNSGRPAFSYTVHRASELQADAFAEMRDLIEAETERPVFAGVA